MSDLSQDTWSQKLNEDNNSFLLDVRTDKEVKQGYIPIALNLDIHKG